VPQVHGHDHRVYDIAPLVAADTPVLLLDYSRETGMTGTEPLTYSVDEVAALLGIARGVAYECVRNGSIPATQAGRR
jgi:excisionase family DNA binding protein